MDALSAALSEAYSLHNEFRPFHLWIVTAAGGVECKIVSRDEEHIFVEFISDEGRTYLNVAQIISVSIVWGPT